MNERKAGIILSYTATILVIVVSFVFIPALVHFLGQEQFGLYKLVGALIGYLTIFDFGMANTTTRYYSQYMARGDKRAMENLLATNGILYIMLGVAIAVAGYFLFDFLVPFYRDTLNAQDLVTAKKLFYIMLVNVAVIIPGQIFVSVINSYQKFIFAKGVLIFTILFRPLSVVVFLMIKSDVIMVAAVETVFNIAMVLFNALYVLFVLKAKFKLHCWDNKLVKNIIRFSFFVFLIAFTWQLNWFAGQAILGAVSGTIMVAVYAVAMQIAMGLSRFSFAFSGVFLPFISSLAGKSDDMTEINNIFIKVGRLQFLAFTLLLTGFILYGKYFILLWVGDKFLDAYLCTILLTAAIFIPSIQEIGLAILQAKNKHAFRGIIGFIFAVINMIIAIPLSKCCGALGCAAALLITFLIGQVFIMNIYYAKIGLHVKSFWQNVGKLAVPAVPVFIIGFIGNFFWPRDNFVSFTIKIILFSLIYCAVMWKFALNGYEKNLFLKPLCRLKSSLLKKNCAL